MTEPGDDGQCCLCGTGPVVARVALPPRAVDLMKNDHIVAWQDVDGLLKIGFCADDWSVVHDLVLEMGMSPLPRCDVALADYERAPREDDASAVVEDSPRDHRALESHALVDAKRTISRAEDGADVGDPALVEALVVRWALEDLGVPAE